MYCMYVLVRALSCPCSLLWLASCCLRSNIRCKNKIFRKLDGMSWSVYTSHPSAPYVLIIRSVTYLTVTCRELSCLQIGSAACIDQNFTLWHCFRSAVSHALVISLILTYPLNTLTPESVWDRQFIASSRNIEDLFFYDDYRRKATWLRLWRRVAYCRVLTETVLCVFRLGAFHWLWCHRPRLLLNIEACLHRSAYRFCVHPVCRIFIRCRLWALLVYNVVHETWTGVLLESEIGSPSSNHCIAVINLI